MMQKQKGFTLIEIAIVLVIIGLLLGGVLKGQELINNARVRNVISQQDSIKTAYFSFQDRYRALPGDYALATANIPGVATGANGDGNGQITGNEQVYAWNHMNKAGFLTGTYNGVPGTSTITDNTNSPVNAYGGVLQLIFDNVYDDTGTASGIHNIKTGNNIPASIIAEIDRKVDDGNPQQGTFRFSTWSAGGTAPDLGKCTTGGTWNSTTTEANCGGASLL
jgi:prepilin-type N-terminal cleavage/methylation domain-containing protein